VFRSPYTSLVNFSYQVPRTILYNYGIKSRDISTVQRDRDHVPPLCAYDLVYFYVHGKRKVLVSSYSTPSSTRYVLLSLNLTWKEETQPAHTRGASAADCAACLSRVALYTLEYCFQFMHFFSVRDVPASTSIVEWVFATV
jgi:hypothetical protein